jgi:hypothetical protein
VRRTSKDGLKLDRFEACTAADHRACTLRPTVVGLPPPSLDHYQISIVSCSLASSHCSNHVQFQSLCKPYNRLLGSRSRFRRRPKSLRESRRSRLSIWYCRLSNEVSTRSTAPHCLVSCHSPPATLGRLKAGRRIVGSQKEDRDWTRAPNTGGHVSLSLHGESHVLGLTVMASDPR